MMMLKAFSQEVTFSEGNEVKYILIFEHNGKELRVPVPKATGDTILAQVFASEEEEVPEVRAEVHELELDESEDLLEEPSEEFTLPMTEDEVPSL